MENYMHPSKELKLRKTTEISNLPQEIMFNILSRIPVKILCKCKCVAKQWRSMISDPYFMELHHDRSKRNPQILLLDHSSYNGNEDEKRKVIHLSSVGMEDGMVHYKITKLADDYLDILPSGDGLICFASNKQFYIFNPSTQEFVSLPEASASTSDELDAGFGYLPSTNEYKLVHMFDTCPDESIYDIGCEIFTLSNDSGATSQSWRVIKGNCPYPVCGCGVLVNNAFYWMIWDQCNHPENDIILSLDLETEKFEIVPHPRISSYLEGNVMSLVELRGFLCLVDNFACPCVMDIWVLKDYKNKVWVKEYRINLATLDGFDDELTEVTPLFDRDGEIIVDSEQERLHYYDIETQSFRRGKNLNLHNDTKLCLYTDTFFSLGSR